MRKQTLPLIGILILSLGIGIVTSFAEEKNPVVLLFTEKGVIKIELYAKDAPKTVDNFLKLIKKGFYDGLTFHRYIKEFIIQGGDPNGDGTGGPGYTIQDEHTNGLKHVKGAIAMARTSQPDSAGSQFYLCLAPAHFLDNQYTVFGRVIQGMDSMLKLRRGDVIVKMELPRKYYPSEFPRISETDSSISPR